MTLNLFNAPSNKPIQKVVQAPILKPVITPPQIIEPIPIPIIIPTILPTFKIPEIQEELGVKIKTNNKDFFYTPAIGEQILANYTSQNPDTIGNKNLTWWEKGDASIFKYPGVLVSAYYGLLEENKDSTSPYREKFNIAKDTLFIGDSGGFQRVTLDRQKHKKGIALLTAENVTAWQERNCDIGFILDQPPYMKDPSVTTAPMVGWSTGNDALFNEALAFTYQSAQIATSQYNPKNMKLYGVVQGKNYQELTTWYNTLNDDFQFDGWAFSSKPTGDLMQLTMTICFAIEMGIELPLHFFALSGVETLALLIYLLRTDEHGETYYPAPITCDSSSYNGGSMYRKYRVPSDFCNCIIFGRLEPKIDPKTGIELKPATENATRISTLPCKCPVCSNITPDILRQPNNLGGTAISFHNLYQYINYINILTSLIEDPDEYKTFIRRTSTRSTETKGYETVADVSKIFKCFDILDNIIKYRGQKKGMWHNLSTKSVSAKQFFM